jgi:hypothetical protein
VIAYSVVEMFRYFILVSYCMFISHLLVCVCVCVCVRVCVYLV